MKNDDTDLPGMLAVAKSVAEQKWPHTMDAAVWAAEYVKLNPGADEGMMLAWFANAIMAGYDTARARSSSAKHDPTGESHPWIGCGECDTQFICHEGANACIRAYRSK